MISYAEPPVEELDGETPFEGELLNAVRLYIFQLQLLA